MGIYSCAHRHSECGNLGLWPRNSFSRNRCFQFSVLVLCSAYLCFTETFCSPQKNLILQQQILSKLHRKSFKLHLLWTGEEVAEPAVLSWACSQYVGQLIYANVYGVTSAAYVLLTTLGKNLTSQPWRLLAMGFRTNPNWTLPQL